jgi:hypothetical protein
MRIVLPKDLPRVHNAIESAVRLRNSTLVEFGLLFLVYSVGLWLWHGRVGFDNSTWYAAVGGRWHLTTAGIWYVFVSIPIVQFILLRWPSVVHLVSFFMADFQSRSKSHSYSPRSLRWSGVPRKEQLLLRSGSLRSKARC